jgi:hypothetical protein
MQVAPTRDQIAFEHAIREVYQPSTHLLAEDYMPYCDYADNIKIEELEVEPVKRPSPIKDYHSTTTRADTSSPIGFKDPVHPIETDNFMSAETQQYFSSKFGEMVSTQIPLDPSSKGGNIEQEKEEGDIVKRLKEVIKHHKVDLLEKDLSKDGSDHPQLKKWSSLRDRDDASRSNAFSKAEVTDPSSHHSEKRIVNPQLPTENRGNSDQISSDMVMVAKYDFAGEKSKDLTFKKGDVIRLINKKPNGWWLAEIDGRVGFVPSNYLISKTEFQGIN